MEMAPIRGDQPTPACLTAHNLVTKYIYISFFGFCPSTGCPKKNALSEPRLLAVLLSPQLGKQLISSPGEDLLPYLRREQHWKQSRF